MPKLRQILTELNNRLKNDYLKGAKFQSGRFVSLAYPNTDSTGKSVPTEYTTSGVQDVTISGNYAFQLYHVCTTANFAPTTDLNQLDTVYNIKTVVYFDKKQFQVDSLDLAQVLRNAFVKPFSNVQKESLQVSGISIIPQNANFNSRQVFDAEYPKYDGNKLPDGMVMFSINSQLRVTASPSCVECSDCA